MIRLDDTYPNILSSSSSSDGRDKSDQTTLREQSLADAIATSQYGLFTADALTDKKFDDRQMTVIDVEMMAGTIARFLDEYAQEKAMEARLDEADNIRRLLPIGKYNDGRFYVTDDQVNNTVGKRKAELLTEITELRGDKTS